MKLNELFPSGHFAPPATEELIVTVENELGVKLPEQLRNLYYESDGFREDKGNAKYLLSLVNEDHVGSLLSTTKFMWYNIDVIKLKPFVFFGFSGGDEAWGINFKVPNEIISYHHHMHDEYEIIGSDIFSIYQADYAEYKD